MELMEIYNQVKNPIDDPKVIGKLINAYANSSKGFGGFYSKLTKTADKEYNKGEYYVADADRFYSMMFNKWKNSIVAMTKDEFLELYRHGHYGQDLIKLRKYLSKIPDVSTMEEANHILNDSKNDKELDDAIEKYSWTSFGGYSGWVHVCSRYVTAKKDKFPNIEHRLYLDTESIDTLKMATLLVEKCDQHHLPYYFKFDRYGDRDDTLVIYSSTENLTKYLEILQEIKREHRDLVARAKEPPILTGKIDGWIGYGSEPGKGPNGQNQSFNEVRSKAIEPAIAQTTKKWILDHRSMQVNFQGKKMNVQDYIAIKSAKSLIADLERRFAYYEENEKKLARRNGTNYNQTKVINQLGYSLQDVKSLQFQKNIFRIMRSRIEIELPKVCNGSYKDMNSIIMNVRNGKQISFSGYDLETVIQEFSPNIVRLDSNFVPSVHTQIKNNAKQYGIDINKFCFDIKARDKIRSVSIKNESQRRQMQQNQQYNQANATRQNQNVPLKTLDIQSILQIINPSLLERKMKLPDGTEMSAKRYIQLIVYPKLPSTGFVILANGGVLSIKQFIEECVMNDCQKKYNGDFPRYLAENTRNNIGAISFEYDNARYEIDPKEIIKFIDPTLLDQRMRLPNGTEISARQYIQTFFAPHIPINGRITLSKGNNISAKQYIEELLLWKMREKYNGDINKIVFNTTRNNAGKINADPNKIKEALMQLRNKTVRKNQEPNAGSGPKL